jgi:cell division protein FtsB
MMVAMSGAAKSLSWLLPFGLLLCVVLIVPLRMLDKQGLPRYRALREELHEVRGINEQMRREVRQLEITVRALRSSPDAIENIARDELGMLLKNELLFQFPREPDSLVDRDWSKP